MSAIEDSGPTAREEERWQSDFKLACSNETTVLVTGESGTGKTRLARKIHDRSSRRLKPFVTINLATLHEGTLEAELFGHEKGAYTGADQKRMGRMEAANGGTIFLDEISELPLRLQARLLDFLQFKTITPIGSNREVKLNVRIIAATNRNLELLIKEGKFREDLFYRLRVIQLDLQSLKERMDQFRSLTLKTLRELSEETGLRGPNDVSSDVWKLFANYSWPGNIRELRNTLEASMCAAGGGALESHHLPRWFVENASRNKNKAPLAHRPMVTKEITYTFSFYETLSRVERDYLMMAYRRCNGKLAETARTIGMNKTTLLRRLRACDITSQEPIVAEAQ